MGNTAQPSSPLNLTGAYADVGTRTLRQLQTFNFPQTITSATTVAIANTIPQRTQGDEIYGWYFTPYSTQSIIEVEFVLNVYVPNQGYLALFNDYQNDAMVTFPLLAPSGFAMVIPVMFNHYFQPLQAGVATRFSIRSAPTASTLVFNYYAYGYRNVSRVTMKEWSSLSLQNN